MIVVNGSAASAYHNAADAPSPEPTFTNDDAPHDPESDLSDTAHAPVDAPSPASSAEHVAEFGQSDVSSDEDAKNESEDADLDMEDSPQPVAERTQRSSSVESRRPTKRKLATEEDPHIMANPELYGLRRSVGLARHEKFAFADQLPRDGRFNNAQWYVARCRHHNTCNSCVPDISNINRWSLMGMSPTLM